MPNSHRSDIGEKIWMFLRGDLPPVEFEQWVRDTPELEMMFGPPLFQEVISADYRNWLSLENVSESLETWVDEHYPRDCDCITWANDEKISVDSVTVDLLFEFDTLKKRTLWLKLIRCVQCGTHWYVGIDTDDDWYYLHRLKNEEVERILASDEWPDCFDNVEPFLGNK